MVDEEGVAYTGTVVGDTYTLSGTFPDGGKTTTMFISFDLSASTSGSGTANWSSTDCCAGQFDISLTKQVSSNGGNEGDNDDDDGGGGGGGGGGGCFIATGATSFEW